MFHSEGRSAKKSGDKLTGATLDSAVLAFEFFLGSDALAFGVEDFFLAWN